MNDYEAKDYYQNIDSAGHYASQFHKPLSLSNLRTRIFGWREEQAFLHMLRQVSDKPKKALDIASGTGRYVELLLNHGYQVGGVDISKEMLSFAERRVGGNPNLLFLQQCDAETLPFPDHQYDLVTCIRLYHRVPSENRHRMLREVKRVGRGKAILFFGMTNSWLQFRRAIRSRIISGRPSNPYPVTRTQLVGELEAEGFTLQDSAWVLPLLADGLVVLVTWQGQE
jgi:SAM-dependent methyltransferase